MGSVWWWWILQACQAASPLVIGAAVAALTYWQARTAAAQRFIDGERLALSLFESRYKLFDQLLVFLAKAVSSDAPSSDQVAAFERETGTATFLFADDAAKLFWRATVIARRRLTVIQVRRHRPPEPGDAGYEHVERQLDEDERRALREAEAIYEQLASVFGRYLSFDHLRPTPQKLGGRRWFGMKAK